MRLLFLLIFLSVISPTTQALEVQNVRIGQHPDKTRIVLEMDETQDFRAFTLSDPYRIVLDIPHAKWNINPIPSPKNNITNIRHGQLDNTLSRVVFDLKNPATIKSVFALPANGSKPDRLVIDFANASIYGFNNNKNKVFGTLSSDKMLQKPTIAQNHNHTAKTPPKTIPKRKPIIVIDPGHGGQDPGAVSGKIYEKNITFALAKQLKSELEKSNQFKVYLTRTTDTYIKLHERVKFAKHKEADLFISIHADTIHKSHVRGASIYTLSEKASDAQTGKLAARENKVDLIAGVDLSHEDQDVTNILIDLVQRDTMNQSNYFAEKLVKELKTSGIRMLENPHRSAGFAVLKAPDIPSILIEAGFISNRQDAKLLNTTSHRQKIAKIIASGIKSYLNYLHKNHKM